MITWDDFRRDFKAHHIPPSVAESKREEFCHGIVTAVVLVKGLSRGAIATRKLKGVNRNKGYERFILVRPLAVKVKPSLVVVVLLGFDNQGANTLAWLSIYCFLP